MRQKTGQLELPLEDRGEAPRAERSGEASTAAHENENASTIYRELRKRGLPDFAAKRVAASASRWWKNSGMAINVALPVSYFDGLGLPRLAA